MRHLSACVLVIVAQLHASAQVAGPAAPLTLAAYVAELDRLAAFLRNAPPAAAAGLSGSIAPRWIVDTGRERVAVDTRWLVTGLREATDAGNSWNMNRERLRRRLLELRAHATEAALSAPGPAHHSLRTSVRDVLARPEFQPTVGAQWRERLQQRIGEWIQSIAGRLGIGGVAGRSLALIFAWVAAIAALAGLAIWLVRGIAAGSRAMSLGLAHSEPRRASAREWALRAAAALRADNVPDAVRFAYSGALRRMEEEGVWRLDQSRTPREYLRMLGVGDSRAVAVRDLTELFEQIWYGNRPVGSADADRVSASLEKLGCLQPGDRAI